LTDSTLSGNRAGLHGGGIANNGTLTLTTCTLSGNYAPFRDGGGIDNTAMVTLTNCTLSGNHTESDLGGGGGIANGGTLTLTNCSLARNSAGGGKPLSSVRITAPHLMLPNPPPPTDHPFVRVASPRLFWQTNGSATRRRWRRMGAV
jgi:hypothetical protein